ncbi:MAG: hypothetical protein RL199_68 [Pseudomonadota bacterium]|jgi:hypothetical protein
MMIEAPKRLPSRNLLPLATTVERVYAETPTWLLAVGLAIGLALLAAVSCTQQRDLDQHQCEVTFGAGDARCAK